MAEPYLVFFPKIIFVLLNLVHMILLWRAKKFKPLLIMYLFFYSYVLGYIPYIFFDFIPLDIYGISFEYGLSKLIYIHLFFIVTLVLFQCKITSEILLPVYFKKIRNDILLNSVILIMFVFALTAVSGETIFTSSYGSGKSSQGILPGEYFLLFIPISYIFIHKNSFQKRLVFLSVFVFIIVGLLFGYRNYLVQAVLMIFNLFVFNKMRINYFRTLVAFIFLFIFLSFFGQIRASVNDFSAIDVSNPIEFSSIDAFIIDKLGHQMDVIYSSVRFISMVLSDFISIGDRFVSAISSHIALFVPFKFLPDLANLAAYKQDELHSNGGGLRFAYYYVYGGYLGVLFAGLFICWIINKLILNPESLNNSFMIFLSLLFVTYVRWFAYNPITLFKLPFYGMLVYLFLLEGFKKHNYVRNLR